MNIKGKKVVLKPLLKKHLPNCWKWINDKEVTRFLTRTDFPKTYRGEIRWFNEMKEKEDEKIFAIIDIETNKHIGNIGIHQISKVHHRAEIGIMIGDKSYWGKGFGTDAMKTALKYCFKELRLNKVRLTVDTKNKGGIKCYKKCGYENVGFLKEEWLIGGRYHDMYIMEVFEKKT